MLVWEHMELQLGGTLSPAGDTGAGGEAEREDQALSGACSEAGGADPQGAQKSTPGNMEMRDVLGGPSVLIRGAAFS